MSDQQASPAPEERDEEDDPVWAAAIAKASGAEPAPAPTEPEPTPAEDDPEDTPKDAPSDAPTDIWADAPEHLKTAFQTLEQRASSAEANWNRHRNEVSGMSRKIAQLQRELQSKAKEPAAPASPTNDLAAALEGLRQEYPEIGERLQPFAAAIDEIRREVGDVRSTATDAVSLREADVTAAIDREVPGFETLLSERGADFFAWVDDQPKRIREIVRANNDSYVDAPGMVEVLKAFKAAGSPPPPQPAPAGDPRTDKRSRQLSGAAAPPPRSGGVSTEPELDPASDEGWDRIVAKVRKKYNR